MEQDISSDIYGSDTTATEVDYAEVVYNHTRTPPTSLEAPISPPPVKRRKVSSGPIKPPLLGSGPDKPPNLAVIEAGEASIKDHLEYFSQQLSRCIRKPKSGLLDVEAWKVLYRRNCHPQGRHFVVHQHDHPVAGVHYDLRLQISESSSISFAIMYGLPGNPNSRRLKRNATETRVHNLWNHLIESASSTTGSLLIWDTGEYSILPYHRPSSTDTGDETPDTSSTPSSPSLPPIDSPKSESQKLHQAFQKRRIRIRLHGQRLPPSYTISLRLLPGNDRDEQPKRSVRKRRRKVTRSTPETGDEDPNPHSHTRQSTAPDVTLTSAKSKTELEKEIAEEEDEMVRLTNAYPGATNSIGSIHQRRWLLSLDREASGFSRTPGASGSSWVRRARDAEVGGGKEADGGFVVRGRDVETSVLTGRNADEVMSDEGVEGFVGRRGWWPVVE